MTPAPIYLARAGQHECYDRVVFDLNGPQDVGYTAKYVPVIRADAIGVRVPVEGRAALQIIVRGPMYGTDNQGHQPWRQPPAVGEDTHCTREGRRMGLPHRSQVRWLI